MKFVIHQTYTRRACMRHLYKLYRHIDRRAYRGRLPKRIKISFANLRKNQNIAEVHVNRRFKNGRVVKMSARIYFDFRLADPKFSNMKFVVRELVHEIVHIGKPKLEHGYEFELEILRVRNLCLKDQLW